MLIEILLKRVRHRLHKIFQFIFTSVRKKKLKYVSNVNTNAFALIPIMVERFELLSYIFLKNLLFP